MQVDLGMSRLLLSANGMTGTGRSGAGDPVQMARLANRYASDKLGIAPGRAPGAYVPIYKTTERIVEEDVYEAREIVSTEEVFEERAITATRNIYESRAVYEDRAILVTQVQGGRSLSGFSSLSKAGIKSGSGFTVTVGDGETAAVKFASSSTIAVTVDGATETFTFNAKKGELQAALLNTLNSIEGLSASYSANGKLLLETSGGQSLTLAGAAGNSTALSKLGLSEGVTTGDVAGYQQVQTGTKDVLVGSQQVTVGVERVKIGEQSVVTGSEMVKTGAVSKLDGYDRELIGLERPERYGAGVLGSLEGIGGGGLPANYVEALFGRIEAAGAGPAARTFESEVRAAYDEAERLSENPAGRLDAPVSAAPKTEKADANSESA